MTETVVTLSAETEKQVKHLAFLKKRDFNDLLNELTEKGVKDACYRIKRNQQVWQQKKALKEKQEEIIQRAKDAGLDLSDLGID